jgi:hypothetical protein
LTFTTVCETTAGVIEHLRRGYSLGFDAARRLVDFDPERVKDVWEKQRLTARELLEVVFSQTSAEKRPSCDTERSDRGHKPDQEQDHEHEPGR